MRKPNKEVFEVLFLINLHETALEIRAFSLIRILRNLKK